MPHIVPSSQRKSHCRHITDNRPRHFSPPRFNINTPARVQHSTHFRCCVKEDTSLPLKKKKSLEPRRCAQIASFALSRQFLQHTTAPCSHSVAARSRRSRRRNINRRAPHPLASTSTFLPLLFPRPPWLMLALIRKPTVASYESGPRPNHFISTIQTMLNKRSWS